MTNLRTLEDVYEVLSDVGIWSGSHERREALALKLSGSIEARQIELLFLEARDFAKSATPEALVQAWFDQDRWRDVLSDRAKRGTGQRKRGLDNSPAPDMDTRARCDHGRIQDERFAAFRMTHPELADELEARRAFRDQDIRTHLRERGIARTCEAWNLTEREVREAQARWLEDQKREPMAGNLKLAEILPKDPPKHARRAGFADELKAARARMPEAAVATLPKSAEPEPAKPLDEALEARVEFLHTPRGRDDVAWRIHDSYRLGTSSAALCERFKITEAEMRMAVQACTIASRRMASVSPPRPTLFRDDNPMAAP